MNTKHTPKPWTLDWQYERGLTGERVSTGYRVIRDQVGAPMFLGCDKGNDRAEANARLAVVAPELLEALELALGDTREFERRYDHWHELLARINGGA